MKKVLVILSIIIFTQNFCYANSSTIIENANQKEVLNKLIKCFILQGASIENATDYSFTAVTVNNSLLTNLFLGSGMEKRLNFSAVQNQNDVILSLAFKMTTKTGSGYQNNIYGNSKDEQQLLNVLKSKLLESQNEVPINNYKSKSEQASRELFSRGYNASSPAQFYIAINSKNYELCKLFVDAKQIDLNKRYMGMPYLLLATYNNSPKLAYILLKNGADPRIKSIDGGSSLFYAVKNGQTQVVEEMLKTEGMNINRHRMLFRVPLITTAKRNGYIEIEQMLVNYKKEYEANKKHKNEIL